tara:strand:+ start:3144 stop:3875 length:732 start_codon:yes stop_codon:yes gene_type:complete
MLTAPPGRDRRAVTMRIDRPIPFSRDAVQATLSTLPPNHWFRCAAQSPVVHELKTTGAALPPSPWGSPTSVPGPLRLALDHGTRPRSALVAADPDTDPDEERRGLVGGATRPADPCRCLDCDRGTRPLVCLCAGICAVFLAVCGVVLVLIVVRVDTALEHFDTAPLTAHMHQVLNEAHEAAANSRDFGTDLRHTLALVTPALMGAVNATTGMVQRMDDFSQHPAWTISAGLPGMGGPPGMPMG